MNPGESATREADYWPGISCTSWLWPFTQDKVEFELRRAIGNLTHGMRRTSDGKAPTRENVLRCLEATHELEKAIKKTMHMIALEAVTRGASWRDVGECLNVGKTAAHKRFNGRPSEQEREFSTQEADASGLLELLWSGAIGDDRLGFDDEDWEAAPPHVSTQYALRNLPKASINLHKALMVQLGEEGDPVLTMYRACESLRLVMRTLATKKAVDVINECISEHQNFRPWIDEQPGIYFAAATQRCMVAHIQLDKALKSPDRRERLKWMILAHHNTQEATMIISRPECVDIISALESKVRDSGHPTFPPSQDQGGNLFDILSPYWEGDKAGLADAAGVEVDELTEELSFNDRLEIIEILLKDFETSSE
ncbi:hypothetical protein [Streptomyces cuspidosporus]|uniref:hypothetical protein n=1 Tax=Streptomyces cuspidosporus TaxID=66882 RepID=UPI0031FDD85D